MNDGSAIYVGSVMHRRMLPLTHRFRYATFWLLIDLDEIPAACAKLRFLSHNRANLFSLHDRDHGDGTASPLADQARRKLHEAGIDLGGGTIRLLCMPRTLGYCFNPLSVYFCFRSGGTLAALIYQVHNTFGERHSYVIPVSDRNETAHHRCRKAFYVSPFMEMPLTYDFRVTVPAQQVTIGIRVSGDDGTVMNALLVGRRRDLTDAALLRLFATMPAISLKVMGAIHWEALRLYLRRLRYHPRPMTSPPEAAPVSHLKNLD